MRTANPSYWVLGSGHVASALVTILDCGLITRRSDERGWEWPSKRRRPSVDSVRLVIALGSTLRATEVIRLHRQAWECTLAGKQGCLIYGVSPATTRELARRDVFGRTSGEGDLFADWEDHIGIVDYQQSLAELLQVLHRLTPLHLTAWQRAATTASCLPSLVEAIVSQNERQLWSCLIAAHATDWDSMTLPQHPDFPSAHAYANGIRRWLSAVTAGVTPNWETGRPLFAPFTSPLNNNFRDAESRKILGC
jgi:hypothetical protein